MMPLQLETRFREQKHLDLGYGGVSGYSDDFGFYNAFTTGNLFSGTKKTWIQYTEGFWGIPTILGYNAVTTGTRFREQKHLDLVYRGVLGL